MSNYVNQRTGEVREIDDPLHEMWVASGNPKAEVWLRQPDPPPYNPETQRPPEWIDGAWVTAELTDEERAERARKIWPDAARFWGEFSDTEAEAIATSTHPYVRRLAATLYTWRSAVFSDDPRVSQGLQLLEMVGILTTARRLDILEKI